jgi:hypothetical protein
MMTMRRAWAPVARHRHRAYLHLDPCQPIPFQLAFEGQSVPKPAELKEEVTVQGGRRRGKRQVMKKKTVKDEEGYLGLCIMLRPIHLPRCTNPSSAALYGHFFFKFRRLRWWRLLNGRGLPWLVIGKDKLKKMMDDDDDDDEADGTLWPSNANWKGIG